MEAAIHPEWLTHTEAESRIRDRGMVHRERRREKEKRRKRGREGGKKGRKEGRKMEGRMDGLCENYLTP